MARDLMFLVANVADNLGKF